MATSVYKTVSPSLFAKLSLLMAPRVNRTRIFSLDSKVCRSIRRRSDKSDYVRAINCSDVNFFFFSSGRLYTFIHSWGESAGAISAALHMVANGGDTEGLFRGAFMQSGSPIPIGDITNGQKYYDALVAQTGCTGAADSLQCLREVPYDKLMDAINDSPGILSYQVRNLRST